ncbi:MAG: helix-turn-helix domain-containing protein [Bacillota bacterium]|nr:helix-turn-helix domain-containing protein [Bacillota bacterium]
MDYQQICLELFGTDDYEKLKKISQKVNKNNARGAGRKKSFTDNEIQEMKKLCYSGEKLSTIAAKYNTTRQTISRYVNSKSDNTYRLTLMYKNQPCTVIDADFVRQKIKIQNRTNVIMHRAFGGNENPTWKDFEYFLQDRSFPKTRGDITTILSKINLKEYDELDVLEFTNGKTQDDNLWIRFDTKREAKNGNNRFK